MNRFILRVFPLLTLFLFNQAFAAPSAELWERWSQYNSTSKQTIDHSSWDALLKRYVVAHESGINRFRYGQFGQEDGQDLMKYLHALSSTNISEFNLDEQRAYWINLYNALTVAVVLNEYPLRSIQDVSSGIFTVGPWKKKLISVENEELSLDDIEHRILRPIWQDPRLHYAVNCASIGCPNLQDEAFTAVNTERLLDKGAREYINHPRAVKINSSGNLLVSSIYIWFNDDFGGDTGVIEHLKQFAKPTLANALEQNPAIDDDHYSWMLNSVIPVQTVKKTGRRRFGS